MRGLHRGGGADFADDMLAEAARRWPGAEFRHCDAEDMPFEDERFDAVASNFGFLHFPYPEVALAETARVLKSWRKARLHRLDARRGPQVPDGAGHPGTRRPGRPPRDPARPNPSWKTTKNARAGHDGGRASPPPELTGFTLYMRAEEPARIIEVFEKSTRAHGPRASPPRRQKPERRYAKRWSGCCASMRAREPSQVPMQARLISAEEEVEPFMSMRSAQRPR